MNDNKSYGPFVTAPEAYNKKNRKCKDYEKEKGLCEKMPYSYPYSFFIR